MHDRRNGVEEGEGIFTGERADGISKRRGGERARRDDDAVPFRGWFMDFFAADRDQRLVFERRADRCSEGFAIDGKCAAGRNLVGVGGLHHQRAQTPHFGVKKADGASLGVVRPEGVGTNQFGQLSSLVHGG